MRPRSCAGESCTCFLYPVGLRNSPGKAIAESELGRCQGAFHCVRGIQEHNSNLAWETGHLLPLHAAAAWSHAALSACLAQPLWPSSPQGLAKCGIIANAFQCCSDLKGRPVGLTSPSRKSPCKTRMSLSPPSHRTLCTCGLGNWETLLLRM